jgi:hypothetical protein
VAIRLGMSPRGMAMPYKGERPLLRRMVISQFNGILNCLRVSPFCILKKILSSSLAGRVYTEMLFLFTARKDPLVYEFTVREYWPAVRRGRNVLDTDSMLSFLLTSSNKFRKILSMPIIGSSVKEGNPW